MESAIHVFFTILVKAYHSKIISYGRLRKQSKVSEKVEQNRQRVNGELLVQLQECKGKHWDRYLSSIGVRTSAVYGAGAVGRELMRQLKLDGCRVQYFVDKFHMESEAEGMPVLQFRRDYLPEVDAVIITPCHEFDFIVYQLQNYYGRAVKLLALDKMIKEMLEK